METYAIHKSAMVAPRKARMTMDLIRGKDISAAHADCVDTYHFCSLWRADGGNTVSGHGRSDSWRAGYSAGAEAAAEKIKERWKIGL